MSRHFPAAEAEELVEIKRFDIVAEAAREVEKQAGRTRQMLQPDVGSGVAKEERFRELCTISRNSDAILKAIERFKIERRRRIEAEPIA